MEGHPSERGLSQIFCDVPGVGVSTEGNSIMRILRQASRLSSDFTIKTRNTLMEENRRLFQEFAAARDEGFIWHFCILTENSEDKQHTLTDANIPYRLITCSRRHWLLVRDDDVKKAEELL